MSITSDAKFLTRAFTSRRQPYNADVSLVTQDMQSYTDFKVSRRKEDSPSMSVLDLFCIIRGTVQCIGIWHKSQADL